MYLFLGQCDSLRRDELYDKPTRDPKCKKSVIWLYLNNIHILTFLLVKYC